MDYSKPIGATPARHVVGILTSDRFVRDFAAEIPVTLIDSEVTHLDDGIEHQMRCEFATEGFDLPSAIKRFLPDIVRLDWKQTWSHPADDRADAVLHIRTHGRPSAEVTGTAALAHQFETLHYSFTGRTHVDVPFAGKKLGTLVDENLIVAILDDQVTVLRRHLGA